MSQPFKKEEYTHPFFSGKRITVEELAAQQGVKPVDNLDDLKGDFWPEEENIDEFIETLYRWRSEAMPRDLPE
jgi:hypothetical protein